MSNPMVVADDLSTHWDWRQAAPKANITDLDFERYDTLPESITKAASQQTYYTIRFLVDPERRLNAYRAYAYFRWVDDWLDERASGKLERMAFVEQQKGLIEAAYQGEFPSETAVEERMLLDLVQSDLSPDSGLQSYIRNLMAVMAFDACRRGRLISGSELDCYTHHLAVAVTDALHYFIGHQSPPPESDARYLPATAAHIIHMLRDTFEDNAAGYFNVPHEFLKAHGISPTDVESEAYKVWVKSRVEQARDYFQAGREYLSRVPNRRTRMAGYAYIARFEYVLKAIEDEGYCLRSDYPERKAPKTALKMVWSVLRSSLGFPSQNHILRVEGS